MLYPFRLSNLYGRTPIRQLASTRRTNSTNTGTGLSLRLALASDLASDSGLSLDPRIWPHRGVHITLLVLPWYHPRYYHPGYTPPHHMLTAVRVHAWRTVKKDSWGSLFSGNSVEGHIQQ